MFYLIENYPNRGHMTTNQFKLMEKNTNLSPSYQQHLLHVAVNTFQPHNLPSNTLLLNVLCIFKHSFSIFFNAYYF